MTALREAVRNHRTDEDRDDFDELYGTAAEPLAQQAFLLTGDPDRAVACVQRAFAAAWGNWPEVAADPEPGRWVRTAVYADALSPWRGRLPRRRPRGGGGGPAESGRAGAEAAGGGRAGDGPAEGELVEGSQEEGERAENGQAEGEPAESGQAEGAAADSQAGVGLAEGELAQGELTEGEPTGGGQAGGEPAGEVGGVEVGRVEAGRAVVAAVRRLPRAQRAALVLHVVAELDAAAIAVEAEASTPATQGRIAAARTALAHALGEGDPDAEGFDIRLGALLRGAALDGCRSVSYAPAEEVRRQGAVRTWAVTGTAGLLVVMIAGAAAATALGIGPSRILGDHGRRADPSPTCTSVTGEPCGQGAGTDADADAPRAPHPGP
ncbi:SigE family RNA polymerase sigma factor [Peterkaempfera bronchialis]|uniref:hypothetical protein n=1 Tax=Peterkaempfera bronchialis TaxID=2126346 RepID=UPI000DAB3C3E|nr:hypothetical protein [Peterkaempfera bronchialis]